MPQGRAPTASLSYYANKNARILHLTFAFNILHLTVCLNNNLKVLAHSITLEYIHSEPVLYCQFTQMIQHWEVSHAIIR